MKISIHINVRENWRGNPEEQIGDTTHTENKKRKHNTA